MTRILSLLVLAAALVFGQPAPPTNLQATATEQRMAQWYYPGSGLGETSFTSGPTHNGWQPNNYNYGNDIPVGISGTATKMAFRGNALTGTRSFKIGLYDSSGSLIAQATISGVTTTAGWWEATINVAVSSGTHYVMVSCEDTEGAYYYNTGDTGKYHTATYAASMAATITPGDEPGLGYAVRVYVEESGGPTVHNASATVATTIPVAVAAQSVKQSALAISINSATTADAFRTAFGSASLSTSVPAAFTGRSVRAASLAIPFSTSMEATAVRKANASASIEQSIPASFAARSVRHAAAAFPVSGGIAANATATAYGSASLETPIPGTFAGRSVRLAGAGFTIGSDIYANASVQGSSTVNCVTAIPASFAANRVKKASINLPVSGDITATATGISKASAALSTAIGSTFAAHSVRKVVGAFDLSSTMEASALGIARSSAALQTAIPAAFSVLPVRLASVAFDVSGDITFPSEPPQPGIGTASIAVPGALSSTAAPRATASIAVPQ